ncbi:MAG TPA: pantoate--beta-alanine ligase [Sediminibacterium sp.]|nr:pantoate--beta-alanine ligase [Sediminibacterium sp.]
MILCKTENQLRQALRHTADTGFVPTMGALHQGHLALIRESRQQHACTIASIFVNPTQFNEAADFTQYPRTLDKDIALLLEAGCDVLFLPATSEIYPRGTENLPHYDLGRLEQLLEGKFRPGHFQGVCQVVYRLLTLVKPSCLYLGEKDYQQCLVIREMIRQTRLPVQWSIVPTLREESGLAMSSRNLRLSAVQRSQASAIYEVLHYLKTHLEPGSLQPLLDHAEADLLRAGFKQPDYIAITDAETLETVDTWNGRQSLRGLIAARMGDIRLIDNMRLN